MSISGLHVWVYASGSYRSARNDQLVPAVQRTKGLADILPRILHHILRSASEGIMKPSLSVLPVLAITLLIAPGCRSSEPVAPKASEALPVSVQTRTAAQSELIPTLHASPSAGSVTIRVTRGAMCATLVSAAVSRGVGEVDVVSQVSADPRANCAPIPIREVVDYTGTVNSLSAGAYRIRVFEGEGDRPPKFIGSVSVTVPSPDA